VESALWQGDQHSLTIEVQGVTMRVASAPLPEPPLPGTALGSFPRRQRHADSRRCRLAPPLPALGAAKNRWGNWARLDPAAAAGPDRLLSTPCL
jgi:hypothetical protein